MGSDANNFLRHVEFWKRFKEPDVRGQENRNELTVKEREWVAQIARKHADLTPGGLVALVNKAYTLSSEPSRLAALSRKEKHGGEEVDFARKKQVELTFLCQKMERHYRLFPQPARLPRSPVLKDPQADAVSLDQHVRFWTGLGELTPSHDEFVNVLKDGRQCSPKEFIDRMARQRDVAAADFAKQAHGGGINTKADVERFESAKIKAQRARALCSRVESLHKSIFSPAPEPVQRQRKPLPRRQPIR